VSLSGDTLVAQSGNTSFSEPQVIKVYQAPGGDWTKVKKMAVLSGSDANGKDLGFHLVISGDTVAATSGTHNAIYVFAKPAAGWSNMTETAQLDASGGGFSDQPASGIGFSLAMDGGTIITTPGGSFYGAGKAVGRILLYTQPGGGWTTTHAPTAVLTVDDAHSAFADQLAIAGTAVYASSLDSACGFNIDCAHIFIFDMPGGGWVDAAPDDGVALPSAPFTGSDTVSQLGVADGVMTMVLENAAACPVELASEATLCSAAFALDGDSPVAASDLDVKLASVGVGPVVGQPFALDASIANPASTAATAVSFSLDLPAGLGTPQLSDALGSCHLTGGKLTCSAGTLGQAGAKTMRLSFPALAGSAKLTFSAKVSTTAPDRDLRDNAASLALTPDRPPVAQSESGTITQDTTGPVADAVVSFDGNFPATDPDGDTLTYRLVKVPDVGTVNLSSDGKFDFLCVGCTGTYVIEWVANDGRVDSNPATETMTLSIHSTGSGSVRAQGGSNGAGGTGGSGGGGSLGLPALVLLVLAVLARWRRALAALAVAGCFVALSACGGGGATAQGSNGTTLSGDHPGDTPTFLTLDPMQAGDEAFGYAEVSLGLGDMSVGLVQYIQQGFAKPGVSYSQPCDAGGDLRYSYVDADGSHDLSAGDTIDVSLDDCPLNGMYYDGAGSAAIHIKSLSGSTLTGDVKFTATYDMKTLSLPGTSIQGALDNPTQRGPLLPEGALDVSYAENSGSEDLKLSSGSGFGFKNGEEDDQLSGYVVEKKFDGSAYSFSIAGTLDSATLGAKLTFKTLKAFRGTAHSDPTAGDLYIGGPGKTSAQFLYTDIGPNPNLFCFEVDGNGDGRYDGAEDVPPTELLVWNLFVRGLVFQGTSLGQVDIVDPLHTGQDGALPLWQPPTTVLPMDDTPFAVAVDEPRGRLYVSIPNQDEVEVISESNHGVLARITGLAAPTGLNLSHDGSTLYVALGATGSVALVDPDTLTVSSTIDVHAALGGMSTYDVAEAQPGILFITGNGASSVSTKVARLDVGAGTSTTVAGNTTIREAPRLAVSPDGNTVYVSDNPSPSSIYVLDATQVTAPVVRNVGSVLGDFGLFTLTPDGAHIIGSFGDQVFATSDLSVLPQTLETGLSAEAPDGKLIYVNAAHYVSSGFESPVDLVLYDPVQFKQVGDMRTGCPMLSDSLMVGRSPYLQMASFDSGKQLAMLGPGYLCMSTVRP
ncbi:MAG TPA: hypothetical protein VGM16_00760, partial [Gammaproteobacteria bacterium]